MLMLFKTKQKFLLFLILFAHVTLLDFAFIGRDGNIVFLWQQSLELKTISVHLLIASTAWLCFIGFNKLRHCMDKKWSDFTIKTMSLVSLAIVLVIIIAFLK